MRSLAIASTGMLAQQTNVEVISNNIANMSTTGFKRRRAEFQDLLYQNLGRVGAAASDDGSIVPSGAQLGLGVRLSAMGDNLLLETPASGQPNLANPGTAGYGQILQGFIETSNVNVVQEITSLITAQRAYEMNSKVITTSDEMLSTLSRMR